MSVWMNLNRPFSTNFANIRITNFYPYSGRSKLFRILANWFKYISDELILREGMDRYLKGLNRELFPVESHLMKGRSAGTLPYIAINHNTLIREACRFTDNVEHAMDNTFIYEYQHYVISKTGHKVLTDFTQSALYEAFGPYIRKNTLLVPDMIEGKTAVKIAEYIADGNSANEKPLHGILADILEDMDFQNKDIINHLRIPHLNNRQPCWAVAAILGRHPAQY